VFFGQKKIIFLTISPFLIEKNPFFRSKNGEKAEIIPSEGEKHGKYPIVIFLPANFEIGAKIPVCGLFFFHENLIFELLKLSFLVLILIFSFENVYFSF
jgi:hypothetical protein